jgi:putative Mg2+ transporter-C (MgtC) family protein
VNPILAVDPIQKELFLDFPDVNHLLRVFVRLTVAVLLGGAIGFQRQLEYKAAGLRTHMLVALGAALFAVVPLEAGMNVADLSRVIQGVATGIGFLGAGTIIKLSEQHEVRGLTSAAAIWLTAAVGMSVGAGWLWPGILAAVLAWVILAALQAVDRRLLSHHEPSAPGPTGGHHLP